MSGIKKVSVSVRWFPMPTDDVARAEGFHNALFGWNIRPFCNPRDESQGEAAKSHGL